MAKREGGEGKKGEGGCKSGKRVGAGKKGEPEREGRGGGGAEVGGGNASHGGGGARGGGSWPRPPAWAPGILAGPAEVVRGGW